MTSIKFKELREQTGALLDRVKQGPRFRVILPPWDEIRVDVRKAWAQAKRPPSNPILAESGYVARASVADWLLKRSGPVA